MTLRPTTRLTQRLAQLRPSIPLTVVTPRAHPSCRHCCVSPALLATRWASTSTSTAPSHPKTNRLPQPSKPRDLLTALGLASLLLAYTYTSSRTTASLDAGPELPSYRLSEIRLHDGTSPNPWVIHNNKVYDITDWIPAHPGGDVILRAAGGSIDKYWEIFSIHKSQYVYDILDTFHIGYVDARDLGEDGTVGDEVEDPFDGDPERHAELITRTEKPRNAETPGYALDGSYLTPNELFYVRNHMWVPKVIEPDSHVLTIELLDGTEKSYTLSDLKTKFPQRSITAVLQCSGNRRANMNEGSSRNANGLPWSIGAISNATWQGVALADVLSDAGFKSTDADVKHVHFSGMEAYAASIPIRKATDPYGDVLLAWGMNGAPLPPDHGSPLRCVVPGNVAARSVKWLKKITLSDEESPSQWQRRDYKCFGPNEIDVDWDAAPAIQEMPVQSAITTVDVQPADEKGRPVKLSGYAYSGGGRAIVRVDISLNDGQTWHQATLLPDTHYSQEEASSKNPSQDHASWSWKRWRFTGTLPFPPSLPTDAKKSEPEEPEGRRQCTNLVVKATDESYNTQPESYASTWNIRGNCTNAWHKVRVCADCNNGILRQPSKKA